MSLLFAASLPSRTQGLVLHATCAHWPTWVRSAAETQASLEAIERNWGTGLGVKISNPCAAKHEDLIRQMARFERLSASPSAAMDIIRMNTEIDVRPILSAIQVPVLVMQRSGDRTIKEGASQYLAEHIPEAKYVELPGIDHAPFFGDSDRLVGEIEEFLTGSRGSVDPDRQLATVLFTDIVESTRRAATLGDREWRLLLDRHDEVTRQEMVRFRGQEVKSLGDGFLATFDGPARSVRCANSIISRLRPIGIDVRIGIHTGEIEVGRQDIGGIAVHTASRVMNLADPGEVLVSSTVRDLVAGSGLRFRDRGSHTLRGLSEPLRLFVAEP